MGAEHRKVVGTGRQEFEPFRLAAASQIAVVRPDHTHRIKDIMGRLEVGGLQSAIWSRSFPVVVRAARSRWASAAATGYVIAHAHRIGRLAKELRRHALHAGGEG